MAMEFEIKESSKIKGVFIITPNKFSDLRGDIFSVWQKEAFKELLPKGLEFVLDKFTSSKQNVLRGIHGDEKSWKLVSCVWGEVVQVVVDARKQSPTYLQWEKFILNPQDPKLILIPPHFGNAHYATKDSLYFYKWAYEGAYVDAKEQFTLAYNDKKIGIEWGDIKPILSKRDEELAR